MDKRAIHIPLSTEGRAAALVAFGYTVGPRDPTMNSDHPGAFMVHEAGVPADYEGQKDGSDNEGYFCVVGDDLRELVNEAIHGDLAHYEDVEFAFEDPYLWAWKNLEDGTIAQDRSTTAPDDLMETSRLGGRDWNRPHDGFLAVPVLYEGGRLVEVDSFYAVEILENLSRKTANAAPAP